MINVESGDEYVNFWFVDRSENYMSSWFKLTESGRSQFRSIIHS